MIKLWGNSSKNGLKKRKRKLCHRLKIKKFLRWRSLIKHYGKDYRPDQSFIMILNLINLLSLIKITIFLQSKQIALFIISLNFFTFAKHAIMLLSVLNVLFMVIIKVMKCQQLKAILGMLASNLKVKKEG